MGWGEAHGGVVHGAGTTAQIAEAHHALDGLGIDPGPLARRVLVMYAQMHDLIETVAGLTERVERLEAIEGGETPAGTCTRTDLIAGDLPNAEWCPEHRVFHATAGAHATRRTPTL